jgi:hypothetical protein
MDPNFKERRLLSKDDPVLSIPEGARGYGPRECKGSNDAAVDALGIPDVVLSDEITLRRWLTIA